MNKQIALRILVVLVLLGGGYYYMTMSTPALDQNERMSGEMPETPGGKLKVANFEGKLEELNTGCYADGECYVVVDGKHITTLMGWTNATVGVADFDILNANIGKSVEVYAQDKGDGTYTLYGSEGFYVRLK